MTWDVIKPKVLRASNDCVRIYLCREKRGTRVKVRFGSEVMRAMRWVIGDRLQVLFDVERSYLGFQKSNVDSYRLTGKHKSGTITIGFPDGRVGKAVMGMRDTELKPHIDGNVLMIDARSALT